MEMLGRRLAYSAVPEGDGGPSRARRLTRAALLACVVGASVAVASRGSALTTPPELYSAASDDDWPTEEMGTTSLDGVDVNIILSRPTRTSIVISCWCASGSTVYVDYWERAKPEPVTTLSAACGAASLVLEATGLSPPIFATSKRKRDSDSRTVLIRQLMCMPSISENTAKALADHFGNLPALLEALSDPRKFPRIRLSDRASLGKRRVEILTEYLLPDDNEPAETCVCVCVCVSVYICVSVLSRCYLVP